MVFDLIRIIYEKTYDTSFYCESSPLFTEILARGLSFGENPDDRRFTSFGSYRSIYIAMAIIKFYYMDKKNTLPNEKELKVLLNSNLGKNNSSIIKEWTDTFYLNQYSNYNYLNETRYFKRNKFQHLDSSQRNSNNSTITSINNNSDFLIAANLVAQIISREAHFYPSKKQKYYMHCNWISYTSTNFYKIDI